jgi:hypothetical protein
LKEEASKKQAEEEAAGEKPTKKPADSDKRTLLELTEENVNDIIATM